MAVTSGTTPSPASVPPGAAPRRARGTSAFGFAVRILALREGSIVVVTAVTFLYFALSANHFMSSGNMKTLLPYFAPLAILAAGEVFVMILGEIDLSVGAVYLFTPFMWHIFHHAGVPLYPSIILALLIAMIIGAINGIVVAYVGMASFVATLAMLFTLDGLALI